MNDSTQTRTVPAFASEAEEAEWWFKNQDHFGRDLVAAQASGTLGRGTVARRARLMQDGILPEEQDVNAARALADLRGMPYDVFLKQLIHQALQREMNV